MQWADYSGGRPSGTALKAAGFGGVIRYIGLGNEGKQINAPEYRGLVADGIQVLLVAELGTGDAWGTDTDDDFGRGASYARIALADARANGIPDSVPIACAADAHAAAFQIDDVVRYARGFESVLGKGRTGFYGFQETLTAVHNAGVGSWYWRCGSAPSTAEKTWTNFWQRNAGETRRTVSGVQCDINEQYLPIGSGGGGGSTPGDPPTNNEEDDDMITVPAGTDEHVNLIVKGKTKLYLACSWNRSVQVASILFYGETGPDLNGTGVGGSKENVKFLPNRPGPVAIPAGAAMATIRYTADHSFALGTA